MTSLSKVFLYNSQFVKWISHYFAMIIGDNHKTNCGVKAPVEMFQGDYQRHLFSLPIFVLENAVKTQHF